MRKLHRTLASLGLVLGAGGMMATGCSDLGEKCENGECDNTTTTTGTGGSGGDGGGGGLPTGCVPSEEGWAPTANCGVFVSSSQGQSAAAGTPDAPIASVAEAVAAAESQGASAVYLCAEDHVAEAVTLPSGISLFGGVDCNADWAHTDTKSAMTAGADEIPLTVTAGGGTSRIEDVAVTAVNAQAAGGSSIAMLADQGTADLARVDLTAGNGVAGADGPPIADDATLDGEKGQNGTNGCTSSTPVDAPVPQSVTCPDDTTSMGGRGGGGLVGDGSPGSNGGSVPPVPGAPQNGGDGQAAAGYCSSGGIGGNGVSGPPGQPGDGAMGSGVLDATGYHGSAGEPGQGRGAPGQGGGGGGGTSGAIVCNNGSYSGPSGGNGGTGGCGGALGDGGQAGGSSIGLASVDSTVTLTDVQVAVGSGGNGGRGSDGQAGGNPGGVGEGGEHGGSGNYNACDGGLGGAGGRGGAGGGGLGGHSIGIAWTVTAPTESGTIDIGIGDSGDGGAGGDGGDNNGNVGGPGDDGAAEQRFEFPVS